MGETFLFASELKALVAYPGWRGEVDHRALTLYARHTYVPAPWTIYEGVFKLAPGALLSVPFDAGVSPPDETLFWDGRQVVEQGCASLFSDDPEYVLDELDALLRDVIAGQMISDVPLGAFLSGGVDSSLIVSLMQSLHSRPVRTFTIGFSESAYDEEVYARQIAEHLGTDHTEFTVSPNDALAVVPHLADIYDEPFADSSQIPTFLVARTASEHVTVALSGDAGDELFGGYNRYAWVGRVWGTTSRLPLGARGLLQGGIESLRPGAWDRMFDTLGPVLPSAAKQRLPGEKMHKLAAVVTSQSAEEMYHRLTSTWKEPTALVLGGAEPLTQINDPERWADAPTIADRMMAIDMQNCLPDDMLVKVDRAAMANSLETRVPFVDHRVCEFAWRVPLSMKIRDGQGTWLLRQLLYRYVPKSMIERPKMGFGVPIDTWLRGPLRDWAGDLLSGDRIRRDGYFDERLVRQRWDEHQSGRRSWHHHLWTVLMFQAWHDRWAR